MIQHGGNVFFQNTCIDFSANINFLGIPDLVMQAARSGLMAAVQSPQESGGTLEEHIAQWEGVEPAHVFCSNGASEVVKGLVQALQPKKHCFRHRGLRSICVRFPWFSARLPIIIQRKRMTSSFRWMIFLQILHKTSILCFAAIRIIRQRHYTIMSFCSRF